MGFRIRKSVGTKHIKANIGKKGYSSTSIKIAKGVTYNTKRGLTIGIPGTGVSYNFGKKKAATNNLTTKERTMMLQQEIDNRKAKYEKNAEFTKTFHEVTSGYNKKAIIAMLISFVLCVTPLWPLGLLMAFASILWFVIDLLIKLIKTKLYLKNAHKDL
jgi:hypothetical protein